MKVAANCVVKSRQDLGGLLSYWLKHNSFAGKRQTVSGKNWLSSDFHPSQLRLIYDLYGDKIVDAYLDGELSTKIPKLFSCIST